MAKIYALLVGVNDYPENVGGLSGCVNDVGAFHDFLKADFGADLEAEVLTNKDATRGHIIEQFRQHLGRAGQEDTALFVYCGHGGRWAAAPEFHEFYPEAMDEGLVCIDSRDPGGFDLADKELAVLLAEVAQSEPHLAVILDSCHSGSGTRGLSDSTRRRARQTHTVTEIRPLDSYLNGHYSQLLKEGAELRLPASRHVLLAACERYQQAYEDIDDEARSRGLFSLSLLELLAQSGGVESYSDLFMRCRRLVSSRDDRQAPQFEAFEGFDASRGFLNRDPASRPPRYRVFFDGAWKLERGALQGLPLDPERAVGLRIFAEDDAETPVGGAETLSVGLQTSQVKLDLEPEPYEDEEFRAEITSLPLPGIPVLATGDAPGLAAVAAAIEEHGTSGVELVSSAAGTRYEIRAVDGRLELRDRESDRLIQGVAGVDEQAARCLMRPLDQVMAWERALALRNPRTAMPPATVEFWQTHGEPEVRTVASAGEPDPHGADRVTIDVPEGGEVGFDLQARNGSGQKLYMALFLFLPAYGIHKMYNDEVPSGEAPVTLARDTYTLKDGVEEEILTFKLIVSTDEKVEDFVLAMDPLELGRVLSVASTRSLGSLDRTKYNDDWFTRTIEVRLVREGTAAGEREVALAGGAITIRAHSEVTARAGVGASPGLGRSAGAEPLRQLLAGVGPEAKAFAPLTLGGSRDAAGGAQVLELLDIEKAEALSPDDPLEIVLDSGLGEDEYALPLIYDGRHILLGGAVSALDGGRTLVRVDRVPDIPNERRSLGKALKLYFVKTFQPRAKANRLRWVEYGADGSAQRHDEGVAERVAAATSVLLIVHGIIGDTQGMAEGAWRAAGDGGGVASRYDVVLTYDYENLATPIDQTAGELAASLAAVGLGPEDDKQLTVLAHSMGGLVSRWFVEQGGGAAMVNHLVMCGTPNAGSPFGSLVAARKVATVLTTWALNYLPGAAPACVPLLFALNGSKRVTPTLEQMAPGSDFLTRLNSEPPAVPTRYTVLAGNVATYSATSDRWLGQLLADAGGKALETLFGTVDHDVAVRVDSVLAGAEQGSAQQVSCLHTNYFTSPAGLAALADVEW